VTYFPKRVETPTGAFSIVRKFGKWTTDKAGFDSKSTEDLILKNIKGTCVLTTGTSTAIFYQKILKERLIKGRDILAQAGLFLVFLAVFLVARAVFQDEDRYKAQSMLEEAEKDDDKQDFNSDLVLKYSRPFFKRYFTPVVQGMKNKKKIREKYKRKLATAGMTKVLTPEDMFAFKLFLIIGFPILFLLLRQFLEESWPLSIVPVISAIGFKYPDIWLNGKIAKRQEEVINAMPFIVDMLALAVEAGLDFMAAITKVIEKAPPTALSDEFEILLKETKVGASRAEGLRQLAWRTDSIEISSFTATLIAADSVGASIGPILKTLAAEMRQKRSAEAEKKGATAATKILFPMMFLIMPAVGIVIMAPIGLQMMGG
jgi:tight adherence protein C